MGVAAIWDIIKAGFDDRVPFPVFVTEFYKNNGRPVRIAIDAFQWIFECRVNQVNYQGPEFTARLLQNMHYRIRNLIALNVSFVLVFDGKYKPQFKRNLKAQSSYSTYLDYRDFEKDYEEYKELILRGDYNNSDLDDIKELKNELRRWNIDFVEAPAEGEAEAARLQALGIVDYVISNDTDTMIYGATRVLRNFSKLEEDKPAGGATFQSSHSNHFWVTPVDLSKVLDVCGFDYKRLMFLSILTGADYNCGVLKIGIEKAAQLALSSTDKIKKYVATCPYNEFKDFSEELYLIYNSETKLTPKERKKKYEKFQMDLFEEISDNLIEYFGRNEKNLLIAKKLENFPPDYVVMLYYYPLYALEDFKFRNGSTNFAETDNASLWLSNPKFDESFQYYQKNPPTNVTKLGNWFSKELTKAYLLKAVIYNIPNFIIELEKLKINEYGSNKDIKLEMIGIRYKHYFDYAKYDPAEYELDDSPKKKSSSGELEWIPVHLIPDDCSKLTEFILNKEALSKKEEEEAKNKKNKKKSPKKNQSTTLFDLPGLKKLDVIAPPSLSLFSTDKSNKSPPPPPPPLQKRTFYPISHNLLVLKEPILPLNVEIEEGSSLIELEENPFLEPEVNNNIPSPSKETEIKSPESSPPLMPIPSSPLKEVSEPLVQAKTSPIKVSKKFYSPVKAKFNAIDDNDKVEENILNPTINSQKLQVAESPSSKSPLKSPPRSPSRLDPSEFYNSPSKDPLNIFHNTRKKNTRSKSIDSLQSSPSKSPLRKLSFGQYDDPNTRKSPSKRFYLPQLNNPLNEVEDTTEDSKREIDDEDDVIPIPSLPEPSIIEISPSKNSKRLSKTRKSSQPLPVKEGLDIRSLLKNSPRKKGQQKSIFALDEDLEDGSGSNNLEHISPTQNMSPSKRRIPQELIDAVFKSAKNDDTLSPSRKSSNKVSDQFKYLDNNGLDKVKKKLNFKEKSIQEGGKTIICLNSETETEDEDDDDEMVNLSQVVEERTKIERSTLSSTPVKLEKLDDKTRKSLLQDLEDDLEEADDDFEDANDFQENDFIAKKRIQPPKNLKPLDSKTRSSLLESLDEDDFSFSNDDESDNDKQYNNKIISLLTSSPTRDSPSIKKVKKRGKDGKVIFKGANEERPPRQLSILEEIAYTKGAFTDSDSDDDIIATQKQ